MQGWLPLLLSCQIGWPIKGVEGCEGPLIPHLHGFSPSPLAALAQPASVSLTADALTPRPLTPFTHPHQFSDNAAELRLQLQSNFHNISRLMECVGCEKCKMWGKLQILGIATAMKVCWLCVWGGGGVHILPTGLGVLGFYRVFVGYRGRGLLSAWVPRWVPLGPLTLHISRSLDPVLT